jgi:UPF0716 protein FxsA
VFANDLGLSKSLVLVMRFVFLLFIVMPIVEMLLLIKVGGVIGAWYTVGLVLLTAVIGVNLLKKQGLQTLMNAQNKARQGMMPISEIGEGMMLAIAGALLLTPGFVTDAIGFLLLTPGVRKAMAAQLAKNMVSMQQPSGSSFHYQEFHQSSYRNPNESESGVIDAEFEEVKQTPERRSLEDK